MMATAASRLLVLCGLSPERPACAGVGRFAGQYTPHLAGWRFAILMKRNESAGYAIGVSCGPIDADTGRQVNVFRRGGATDLVVSAELRLEDAAGNFPRTVRTSRPDWPGRIVRCWGTRLAITTVAAISQTLTIRFW